MSTVSTGAISQLAAAVAAAAAAAVAAANSSSSSSSKQLMIEDPDWEALFPWNAWGDEE
jgi:hypothetical protein